MRKRSSSVLLGIFLVAAGVGYAGDVMHLWNFELFFSGWWTLFIIIPCAISIIDHGFEAGNIIGLGVGIMLLLAAQDYIDFSVVWRLFLPLLLVALGLGLVFRRRPKGYESAVYSASDAAGNGEPGEFGTPSAAARGGSTEIVAVFSGEKRRFANDITAGARLTAVFGGVEIDLRDSTICNDIIIDCSAVFGGVELRLPPQTPVKFDCFKIFGGASDSRNTPVAAAGGTVYITGTAVFGGIEVK